MITLKVVKVKSNRIGIVGYRVAVENYGTVKLDDVASMMTVNNTCTVADVKAVLSAYMAIIKQDLVRGYSVNMGDVLTLQLRAQSKSTEQKEAWTLDKITRLNPRAVINKGIKKAIRKGAPGINMRMGDVSGWSAGTRADMEAAASA